MIKGHSLQFAALTSFCLYSTTTTLYALTEPLNTFGSLTSSYASPLIASITSFPNTAPRSFSLPSNYFAAVNWKNPPNNSDWFDDSNWSGGAKPTASDIVTIEATSNNIFPIISAGSAESQDIFLSNGGRLTIQSGGMLTNSSVIYLGFLGTGILNIEDGGMVVNNAGYIGFNSGNTGIVSVKGVGSAWMNTGQLHIGYVGNGTLSVEDGGMVTNSEGAIGNFLGSTGTVIVKGSDSLWGNSLSSYVGLSGTGILNVESGGGVTSMSGNIGYFDTGVGIATITGTGSYWNNSNEMVIGIFGTGTLNIEDGGIVTNTSGVIGRFADSTGTVTVTGAGSTWTNNGGLTVGMSGTGTLRIEDGGVVTSSIVQVAPAAGGTGIATVTGAGSQWNANNASFVIGGGGLGILNIEAGGTVSDADGIIGNFSGTGTATVTGAGSQWDHTGQLQVGGSGFGTLTIDDGGVVSAGSVTLATDADSTGTLNINGTAGSRGVLRTKKLLRNSGTSAQANFNGGILRAHENQTHFIDNFNPGELNLVNEGLIIDSNGFGIGTDNVLTGAGSLTKDGVGVLTLTGNNAFTGNTLINDGTLSLGVGGSIASSSGVNITSNTAIFDLTLLGAGPTTIQDLLGVTGSMVTIATATLNLGTANDTEFAGSFDGSGILNKNGTGQLLLSGVSAFSGATNVNAGVLHISGSLGASNVTVKSNASLSGENNGILGNNVTIEDNGTLIGQSGALLYINNNLELNQTSSLDVSLGAPSGSALFQISNNVTLDGQLTINQEPGFGVGVYRLMNYGGNLLDNGLVTGNPDYYIQTAIAQQVNLVNSTGVVLNFWDGSGPFNNGVVNGGTGTWSLSNGNWTDMNGTFDAAYKPDNAFAVFEGAAGTVTIDNSDGQVSATGLQFAVDGYTLTGAPLLLTDDATIRVGDGSALGAAMTTTIDTVLEGVDGLTKTDLGTLVLQGINTYTAGTTIASGVLSISQDGNLGDATGGLAFTGGTLRNTGNITSNRSVDLNVDGTFETLADLILNGSIGGTGRLIKTGSSALVLNGNNTFTSNTLINDGTLSLGAGGSIASSAVVNLTSSAAVLAIGGGSNQTIQDLTGVAGSHVNVDGSLLFGTANSTEFAGVFQGAGDLTKQGSGVFALTGDSGGFAGAMTVNDGVLNVNGILGGDLLINQGGSLMGSGTVGNVTVDGTIAPGNSIGTLTVNGNFTQTANSIYEVEINPQGQSDLIDVSGTANIAGTVEVLKAPGNYVANTQYTILHADGGVSGQYGGLEQLMPFLVFDLNYDSNNVYLVVLRSVLHFADLAITPNEAATANAVESLGVGNPVYDAVANSLNAQQAQQAFNSLSGEIHASALGVFVEESRYLRSAVLNHLQQVFADPGSVIADKFGKHTIPPQAGWAFWSDGYGSWGDLKGNSNAATLDRSTGGVFLGADRSFGEAFRLGLVGGYSHSNFSVDARSSYADSENYYLGAYGGARFNQWGIRVGGGYAWDNIDITRNVLFTGFSNHLTSNLNAHTGQIFAESGYNMNIMRLALEPFAGIAYVNVDNDQWVERGGPSALQGKGSDNVLYSTLGLREASDLYEGERFTVSEKIMLGWQHAYNGLTPQVLQQFVSGGLPFLISGVPIARDSLLIDVGVNWSNRPGHLNLRLSYIGQFANQVQDNGIAGVLSWRG